LHFDEVIPSPDLSLGLMAAAGRCQVRVVDPEFGAGV
jgi:hypothetical protein